MSRASQYQRFGQPQQAQPGTLAYAMQQSGGDVQKARAEYEAYQAGFSSVADQNVNRLARNDFEAAARAAGVSLPDAYATVQGDLTNTSAIIAARNALPTGQQQQQAAPAATEETTPTVEKTEASQTYTSDADKILAGIGDLLAGLPDYSAEMRQLREDMAASQRTLAANLSISQRTPNLQIQPASGTPTTGGTQGFRRRQSQFMPGGAGSVLAGLNLGQPSMMNV